MKHRVYWTYIVASKTRVLYTGFTGNLFQRTWRHKTHVFVGFSDKYNCERLVWMEAFETPLEAIAREKQIKGWLRKRKIALIETANPDWKDLAADWWDLQSIADGKEQNRLARRPFEDDEDSAPD